MNHDSIENLRSVYDFVQVPVVLKDESLTIVLLVSFYDTLQAYQELSY